MKIRHLILSVIFTAAAVLTVGLEQSAAQQSREVILGGFNIEPAVRTTGSGMVTVTLRNDSLTVDGDFSNLSSPYMGAYLMIGKKGESGNMLHRLKVKASEDRTGGTINAKANTYKLSDAQRSLLESGEIYVSITSRKHRKGELRGQIPPIK